MNFYSGRKKSSTSKKCFPKPKRSHYLRGCSVASPENNEENERVFTFTTEGYGTTSHHFRGIYLPEKRDIIETFIEREISFDDSLATLALRYSCPIAELKRLNNIYYDQEIHAFDKIKIPVRPFSVLTDDNTDSGHSSPCKEARIISIGSNLLQGTDTKDSFLCQMDLDLERIRQSTASYSTISLEKIAQELSCKRFHPLSKELNEEKRETLKLCPVLVVGAIITLIIPLIVLIHFLLEKRNV